MRVATLNTAMQALAAIENRQADQARLQSQMSSGLRVQSPGDDPVAAAQAELARSRLSHLAQDQRANQLSGSVLSAADGALGQGVNLLQAVRENLVAEGDAAYADSDRQALGQQLQTLRSQLLAVANTGDGAGGFIFGGQGSTSQPFSGTSNPAYTPAAGQQRIGEDANYATTVDGRAAFMNLPLGNGVFTTASAAGNTGSGFVTPGDVVDPTQITGHGYAISIAGSPGALTYSVTDTTSNTVLSSGTPFTADSPITVAGQRVTISGAPAAGDSFTLAPAGRQSVFKTLDDAIALLKTPDMPRNTFTEKLQGVQASLDRALDGLSLTRSQVGAEMRNVDEAASLNAAQTQGATQRRSDLRDVDIASAITQLQTGQTGMDAALKSYMSIGKTSLFQLLG